MTRNPAENHRIAVRLIRPTPAQRLDFIHVCVRDFIIGDALDADQLNDNLRRNARAIRLLKDQRKDLWDDLAARAQDKRQQLLNQARQRRVA